MKSHAVKYIATLFALAGALQAMPEAESIEAAVAQAKAENKTVLVEFTGRDWCGACKHLRNNILNKKEFDDAVSPSYIMVELDYPKSKELLEQVGKDEMARRRAILEDYGVRGYPTVVMMDENGLPFTYIVGSRNTPADYLRQLQEGQAVRAKRDAAFKKAEGLTGLEKAKALVEGISVLNKNCQEKHEEVLKEIIALDPENTLGYKYVLGASDRRVEQQHALREITKNFKGRYAAPELNKNIAALDEFLSREDLLPETRQAALQAKSECYTFLRDMENALKYAKEAYAADPYADGAPRIKRNIDHLEKVVIPQMQKSKGSDGK